MSKKSKLLLVGALAITLLALSAATLIQTGNQSGFLEQRTALLIRSIGHKLLLSVGDSSSRVLPVKELGSSIFQLEFANPFAFSPDTLANIVQRELASGDLPLNYMVQVFDCATHDMVYGFEIRPNKPDIVPCLGREQPRKCYSIQVAFFDFPTQPSATNIYWLACITATGLGLFALLWRRQEKRDLLVPVNVGPANTLGKYEFDTHARVLKLDSKIIELSNKETKLLRLFAANQNQLIDRDRLLKEVWESEGVFTGRSLDMFVSKLRKKLSHDPAIRIVNSHGRGYMLEISV